MSLLTTNPEEYSRRITRRIIKSLEMLEKKSRMRPDAFYGLVMGVVLAKFMQGMGPDATRKCTNDAINKIAALQERGKETPQ